MQLAALVLAQLAMVPQPQAGDHANESQPDIPTEWMRQPSPVLDAHGALAALQAEPGFRVELVACEPLIRAPIAMAFDPDGSLWVLEMPSYMTDPDGTAELEPTGRVVHLRDTDGDGRMDQATTFLDHLILPRGLALSHGGVLLIEPPNLLFCTDDDGDGRADTTRVLAAGFEGLGSPEHAGNSPTWGHDGWWNLAQHQWRFRFDGTAVELEATPPRGQWGLSIDDFGRCYTSPNSDPLMVDLVPARYGARNPVGPPIPGIPARAAHDMRVWPVALTSGVNRGYQPGFLDGGRLRSFTAACGPVINRDDVLGEALGGNAFVCEAAGNLVQRFTLRDSAGVVEATPATIGASFLASTDERFRPVFLTMGPDGALYIADFARGILQHKLFMTTFLRKQVEARRLAEPTALGRIWRVVPEEGPLRLAKPLAIDDEAQLIAALSSASGFTRDNAQRLLVEEYADAGLSPEGAAALRELARGESPAHLRHLSLWTMHLCQVVTPADIARAAADADPRIRCDVCEMLADRGESSLPQLAVLANDSDAQVRLRAVLAAGRLVGTVPLADLIALAFPHLKDEAIRAAVLSACARTAPDGSLELLPISDTFERPPPGWPELEREWAAMDTERLKRAEAQALRRAIEAAPDDPLAHGARLYATRCANCHQPDGSGLRPVYPPLRNSPYVAGDPARLFAILLHGIDGPLTMDKVTYRSQMPAMPAASDEDIVRVVNYIRRMFAGIAEPVDAALVAQVRAQTLDHTAAFTQAELDALTPAEPAN